MKHSDEELRGIAKQVRLALAEDVLVCEHENDCFEDCIESWKNRHETIIEDALRKVRRGKK